MSIINDIKDPYEWKARVTPGLLVALPIIVPLVCVYGPKHPTLTAVVGLLATCGVTYALASIARGRGKKIEEHCMKKWGGLPTTLALRHSDHFFDSITKKRYHADITNKLDITMPTPEEEARDPQKADDAYMAAARRLRELTRGDKQLLLKENIAYGFHRNMLGMKGVGLVTSLGGLLYGLVIAQVLSLATMELAPVHLASPGLAGGITIAISLFLLFAWLSYFNEDKVRRIGFVYAERLFEHLASLPVSAERNRTSPRKKLATPVAAD